MKKAIFALVACLFPLTASAQTTPVIGAANIKAADDFATQSFQDAWDMNERTDLSWWTYANDQPLSNLSSTTFSNGIFTGVGNSGLMNFFLLETGNPFAARHGRIGTNHPIDATKYQVLALRMNLANSAGNGQLIWWRQTIYDSAATTAGTIVAQRGWGVYLVDITKMQINTSDAWGGTIRTLRYSPTTATNETVSFDWIRLVNIDQTLCRTITWSGGGSTVDLYLDDDTNAANGNLGPIALAASSTSGSAASASAGCPTGGTGYKFYAGALAPGSYKVVVVASGGNPASAAANQYSATTWVVNDAPTLSFTSPSEEGSADDFATTVLGNPWDMDSLSDIDFRLFVQNESITPLPLELKAGSPFTAGVYSASSVDGSGFGDPQLGLLWDNVRGKTSHIDPAKYRILTLEMGVPNLARDVNLGSIARIIWRVAGSIENVSDDIIFQSRAGANVLDKIVLDMADRSVLSIEASSPGQEGWVAGSDANPGIDRFRVDTHEYTPATPFFVKRVKLASLERTNSTYTIRWLYTDSSNTGTVDLYYDDNPTGFDGTLIASNQPAAGGATGFTWTPSGVSLPQVHIYAVFRDTFAGGTNENRAYAKWPILLTQNAAPTVSVNRPVLNFGVLTPPVNTSPQTVRVSVTGTGSACWAVSNPAPSIFSVSPATGNGNGSFTVSLISGVQTGVTQTANLSVGPCGGSSITNSAVVRAVVRGLTFAGVPAGVMDTPADNAVVSGSIAVTGWAIDDVDITSVRIYRDPVAGESGRIFIGDAVRVDDSRTDIEGQAPDTPFNYRAGWGYLLLTNFLPGGGTGTYVLSAYATDRDGHEALLGVKVINGANSSSVVPFGAIDTPGQGETVSGTSYNNFGWVLVRGSARAHPPFGTVSVLIDGVNVGAPGGWTSRSDLSALFPVATYSGVNNALGVFTFNPTTYANGVHTIAWIVTANNGQADGIGSRFFNVFNAGASLHSDALGGSTVLAPPHARNSGADLGRRGKDVGPADLTTPVYARRGYVPASTRVEADGIVGRTIVSRPLERIVVDVSSGPGHSYEAYLSVNGTLGALPIGASFDERRGTLYWQPPVGYLGAYDFVVVRDGYLRIPVRVVLQPDRAVRVASHPAFADLFKGALD